MIHKMAFGMSQLYEKTVGPRGLAPAVLVARPSARCSCASLNTKTRRVNLRVTERDFITGARAGPRGGHPLPDAAVERHPQVSVGPAHGEEIQLAIS